VSLRSPRRESGRDQSGRDAVTAQLPQRVSDGRTSASKGRTGGERPAVYRPPDRHDLASRHSSYHHNPHNGHCDDHHGNDHHGGHHYRPYGCAPWGYGYYHSAFTPYYWGPAYPVSGFTLGWCNGSYAFSVGSYWPAYTSTRYYDSWSCGGWGYSDMYYGGWRSGWYGGFSYVYNPWPVYRSYYLYDPVPVVTRTETVYVTEPAATTYVVNTPPPTTVSYLSPATTALQAQPTHWEAAPAVERVDTASAGCLCPCRCNGQRPCTCDYPCGSEYAIAADAFDLSTGYESYAESLDAQTIWYSYAGLDRWDAGTELQRFEATASANY